VFLVLIYYLILGTVIVTIFTRGLVQHKDFINTLLEYFSCEANGISSQTPSNASDEDLVGEGNEYLNNSTCDNYKTEIGKMAEPYSLTISLVLLGLYPAVYLVYTINCKDLKDRLCTRTIREVVESSQKTSTTTRKKMNPHAYYPHLGGGSSSNRLNTSYPPDSTDVYARPSTFTPPSM